jgi:hypothetical protein
MSSNLKSKTCTELSRSIQNGNVGGQGDSMRGDAVRREMRIFRKLAGPVVCTLLGFQLSGRGTAGKLV